MIQVTVEEKQVRTYEFDDDHFGAGNRLNPDAIRELFLNTIEDNYSSYLVDSECLHYDAEINIPVNKIITVHLVEIIELNHEGLVSLIEDYVGLGPINNLEYHLCGADVNNDTVMLKVSGTLKSQ